MTIYLGKFDSYKKWNPWRITVSSQFPFVHIGRSENKCYELNLLLRELSNQVDVM